MSFYDNDDEKAEEEDNKGDVDYYHKTQQGQQPKANIYVGNICLSSCWVTFYINTFIQALCDPSLATIVEFKYFSFQSHNI